MATGLQVQAAITRVLSQVQATHRPVYFRQVFRSGGNPVLGVGQNIANIDTLLDPQPVVNQVKEDDVASSGGLLQFGDYQLTLAGTFPEDTLKLCEFIYGSDVLKVIHYTPSVFGGVVAAWSVLARTSKAV